MAGPLILHIETATEICSVALSEGDRQLALVESGPERSHATLLNSFIRKVFQDGEKELKQLDAVAISKGPGSYTGLRIGVSTAKGIVYALEINFIASGTLVNMTYGALKDTSTGELREKYGKELLMCPMIDARRMEVYAGFYNADLEAVKEVSADVIDRFSYQTILDQNPVCFFGTGSQKCREVLHHPNAHFIDGIVPSAAQMIAPALLRFREREFEDVAYFEPFYLKDFIATTPKKKLL